MVSRRTFWEWDSDGVKRGERSYVPAETFDAAVTLLRDALLEMARTTSPRNSFTDCVDKIDAFLTASDRETAK